MYGLITVIPLQRIALEVDVVLDREYIQSQGKKIVRQRRAIDFILDPFKKLQKDGLNL
jgi:hemolysin D